MIAVPANRLRALGMALLPALVVMVAGGLMTDQGPWFQRLAQPSWRPPGWLFGPVWMIILALVVLSFAVAWQRIEDSGARRVLLIAFAANGVLNVLWNVLFFQMRRPDLALLEIAFLFLSIAVLMAVAGRHALISALLLAPYALWVGFAAMLNLEIVRINGPFV